MDELLRRLEEWSSRWRVLFVVGGIVSLLMYATGFKMGGSHIWFIDVPTFLISVPPHEMLLIDLLPIILTIPKYLALALVSLPIYRDTQGVAWAFLITLVLLVCIDVAVVVAHFLGQDYYLGNNYWNNVLAFVLPTVIVFWSVYLASAATRSKLRHG